MDFRSERWAYQNVVWLDVGVHDRALLEQRQSKEQLMGVSSDGTDVQTDIFTEAFNDVSEIHAVKEQS